ncbi:MAG: SPASM domain-containing protein [Chitinophagales bacterium]|nr:SPASM domain-containing protein [Chitinophagales bacterium]
MNLVEHIKTRLSDKRNHDASKAAGYHALDLHQYRKYNSFRPLGAKPIFCYVPFNSLTFSFSGKVFACSYNRDVQLGQYPNQTIDQIWNSKEAQQLRTHMSNNDLDYGCQHCRYFFEKGKFSNLKPLVFDKYYENTAATFPQVMEFELSNECNLECQMCVGEVSSSIRKNRDKLPPIPMPYDDKFLEQLAKYIPHLKEAKFYGGEPFLISIYYRIWDLIKQLNPKLPLFVITNGSHWNSKIEALINDLDFDVAVSIDAVDKDIVEGIRKNIQHDKLMHNIRRFSEVCRRKGKYLSLSFTVQKDNWKELPRVIELCNEVDAFIFVSYLERPVEFSITEFSTAQLQEVLAYMRTVSLPRLSQKERHNYRCFEDFKKYIQTYIDNPEEKRYLDYRFEAELIKNEDPELVHKRKDVVIKQVYTLEEIQDHFRFVVSNNPSLSYVNFEEVISKMTEVLSVFDEEEKRRIYSMMALGELETTIVSLMENDVKSLREMARESLPFIKLVEE